MRQPREHGNVFDSIYDKQTKPPIRKERGVGDWTNQGNSLKLTG